jgi:hypothetical protein
MSNVSLVVIKTTETNGITAQFARLLGYEPYRNGRFEPLGENGVKGLYRPMIDVDGYNGVCPIDFTPYDDGTDAMMVAAYLRMSIDVSRDGKTLKASTHEFEAEAELPQNKAYMVHHAKIMRQTIMAVAAMYVKKHYDIDPPVNTTTRTVVEHPAHANVITRIKTESEE